jgi:hypothetical protein
MSSELAAAWRYTYWLECLIASMLDEAGNVSGNSQILQKRQHLEVCNSIYNYPYSIFPVTWKFIRRWQPF